MNNFILKNSTINDCRIDTYPDGQRNLILNLDNFDRKSFSSIKCQIKSFSDFELLLMLVSAIERYDSCLYTVEIVYLIGMRSDRVFEQGGINYFKEIIFKMIKMINCNNIWIFDPHSEKYIQTDTDISIADSELGRIKLPNLIYVAADKSALVSVSHCYFDKSRIESDVKIFLQDRFIKKIRESTADILIYDDLCDGGKTFIEIGNYLQEFFPNKKRYLYVTHALFTKGIDVVAAWYEHIFCTNSYQDIVHAKVTQFEVI